MCGIGGYFLKNGSSPVKNCLDVFKKSLAHRGPDGCGQEKNSVSGFVQTRLAIVDIEKGNQPFVYKSKKNNENIMLVANGEIYNHCELRKNISNQYNFKSNSDCEVILPLWIEHKEKLVSQLRGMFAIAIYDAKSNIGFLARDPFGIKPLYYAEHKSGIYFSSEPKALIEAKIIERNVSLFNYALLLEEQYVKGEDFIFKNIKRLNPGETLIIKNGRIVKKNIHSSLQNKYLRVNNPFDLQLKKNLENTVLAHQMSDVPFGIFYSGGVDSTAILQIMSKFSSNPINAYLVNFDQKDNLEELKIAENIIKQLKAELVVYTYTKNNFNEDTGSAILACDDPIADYAILPTTFLAEKASKDVKVVLTGEGGDEFFAGYGRYRYAIKFYNNKSPKQIGLAIKSKILKPSFHKEIFEYKNSFEFPSYLQRILFKSETIQKFQFHDIKNWLPNNLLIKLDRCLMRFGLEGRTPFVDKFFSNFGFHLPLNQKIRYNSGKYILKNFLQKTLPSASPFRKKHGFTVPVGRWIQEDSIKLYQLLERQHIVKEIINKSNLKEIIENSSKNSLIAWRVLFIALWHKIHIDDVNPHQPIKDILNSN